MGDTQLTLKPSGSNGAVSAPAGPAPNSQPPRQRFHHYRMLEDRHGNPVYWLHPPVPGTAADPGSGYAPLVEAAATRLEADNLPLHAISLRMAHGQALQACQEYDELQEAAARRLEDANRRRAVENAAILQKIGHKEVELDQARQQLDAARDELRDALGTAGIVADPANLDLAEFTAEPEEAATAGEAGVLWGLAPSERMHWLEQAAVFILGAFLAVCVGEVSGVLPLSALDDLQSYWPFLLVLVLLGSCVVYALGRFAVAAVRSIAHRLLERGEDQPPRLVPGRLVVTVLVLLAVTAGLTLACASEVALEAVAIKMLNEAALMVMARLGGQVLSGTAVESLSFGFAALVATTITASYVFFKLFTAWAECEERLRYNWVRHLTLRKVRERLARPEMVEAVRAAGEERRCREIVARTERDLGELRAAVQPLANEYDPATQQALKSSRVAAVGESARLRADLDCLRERLETRPLMGWWERLFHNPRRTPTTRWRS